jgi:hypothetical protein
VAALNPTQHHVIKETGDSIGQLLQGVFKENGYKRVHMIVAPPSKDAIEGKLPALCVYLYNLVIDELSQLSHRSTSIVKTVDGDGVEREVRRENPILVRLDYLISAWAQTPEEEHLLIGGAIKALLDHPVIEGDKLKGSSFTSEDHLTLSMAHKLDEGVLSRFWASLNQPLKPAIQCWTTVPIQPSTQTTFTRVQERDVRFFDLGKMSRQK